MARMKPPIVPDKPVPVVPEDALRRLLAACAGKSFEARRDSALITFLLDTGARRGEVADLRLTDLDFDLDVALSLARAAGSGPCHSDTPRRSRWTATSGCEPATRTRPSHGCGWGSLVA
jgi:site-specific recombinase XerC